MSIKEVYKRITCLKITDFWKINCLVYASEVSKFLMPVLITRGMIELDSTKLNQQSDFRIRDTLVLVHDTCVSCLASLCRAVPCRAVPCFSRLAMHYFVLLCFVLSYFALYCINFIISYHIVLCYVCYIVMNLIYISTATNLRLFSLQSMNTIKKSL